LIIAPCLLLEKKYQFALKKCRNDPISISRDALGKFFVVDSDNSRVQIFDDDGEFQFKFGSSDSGIDEYLGSAKGIAIQESTGNILVSDVERDSISVFDSAGGFLFDFDSFFWHLKSFLKPQYLKLNSKHTHI